MRWIVTALAAFLAGGVAASGPAAQPVASEKLVFATNGDGISDRLEIGTANATGPPSFTKVTRHAVVGGFPTWADHGRVVVFFVHDSFTKRTAYWRLRLGARNARRLPVREGDVLSPSGALFVRHGARGFEIHDAATGRLLRVVRARLPRASTDETTVWSPDGKWIAVSIGDVERDTTRVLVLSTLGTVRPRYVTPKRGSENAEAWSPNAMRLVTSVGDLEKSSLFVVSRDGKHRTRIATGAQTVTASPTWSPDSRRVAYVAARGGVYVVSASGRGRRRVAPTANGKRTGTLLAIAWSPRADVIAITDAGSLYVAHPNAFGRRKIAAADDPPSWSPNGRLLLSADREHMFTIRPNGRGYRLVTEPGLWDDAPSWSPDGSEVAFVRGPRTRDFARDRVLVVRAVGGAVSDLGEGYDPRWSPVAREVVFVRRLDVDQPTDPSLARGRIVVAPATGGPLREVATGTSPAWAPDGKALAFMRYDFRRVTTESGEVLDVPYRSALLVSPADGTGERVLATTSSDDGEPLLYQPSWSPDGRTIAAIGETGDVSNGLERAIYIVDTVTGQVRKLQAERQVYGFAWTPAGDTLVLDQSSRIGAIRADGSGYRVVTRTARSSEFVADAVSSPDGRRVAFVRCAFLKDEIQVCDVWTVGMDGTHASRVTKTTGIEQSIQWAGSWPSA